MKITLKNLQQVVFEIEVESYQTTLSLKRALEEKYKHPVSHQKIIFAGNILQDDQTLGSYKIQEGSKCVLMVRPPKKSAPKKSTAAPPTEVSSPAPKPSPHPVPAAAPPTEVSPPAEVSLASGVSPATAPFPVPSPPPSFESPISQPTFDSSEEFESKVDMIAEMGFEKDQIRVALRSAFGSSERAIEYLMTGDFPAQRFEQPQFPAQEPAAPVPFSASPASSPAPAESNLLGENLFNLNPASQPSEEGDSPSESPLDFLRKHPQFIQLKLAVQQHGPEVLQDLIQQLAATNPQLLQILVQYRDDFIRLLSEPLDLTSMIGAEELAAQGNGRLPPNARCVQVSAEEKDAIERLTGMFPLDRNVVIQAFLVCDRDENSTAAYLLDRMTDRMTEDNAPPS